MEQLTLEEKALDYSKQFWSSEEKRNSLTDFKAGAEWQKEQYSRILQLAFNAANELDSLGDVSLCDHIKTELEKLASI